MRFFEVDSDFYNLDNVDCVRFWPEVDKMVPVTFYFSFGDADTLGKRVEFKLHPIEAVELRGMLEPK